MEAFVIESVLRWLGQFIAELIPILIICLVLTGLLLFGLSRQKPFSPGEKGMITTNIVRRRLADAGFPCFVGPRTELYGVFQWNLYLGDSTGGAHIGTVKELPEGQVSGIIHYQDCPPITTFGLQEPYPYELRMSSIYVFADSLRLAWKSALPTEQQALQPATT